MPNRKTEKAKPAAKTTRSKSKLLVKKTTARGKTRDIVVKLSERRFQPAPPIRLDSRLMDAKRRLETALLVDVSLLAISAESGTDRYGFENIVGIGVSERKESGHLTGELCIAVYVVRKAEPRKVTAESLVPESVSGIRTHVVEVGELRALANVGLYRPAMGGVSIGHTQQVMAGTLGCAVVRGSLPLVLSNNHVLAGVNQVPVGSPIVQPGRLDGGAHPANTIGTLDRFIPLQLPPAVNSVDAATARVEPGLTAQSVKDIGQIHTDPLAAQRDMVVRKSGRTTELTRGVITDVAATLKITYDGLGQVLFRDQIAIRPADQTPFALAGDSGSLVVDSTPGQDRARPVGLLFAASPNGMFATANHIGEVLTALGVSFPA